MLKFNPTFPSRASEYAQRLRIRVCLRLLALAQKVSAYSHWRRDVACRLFLFLFFLFGLCADIDVLGLLSRDALSDDDEAVPWRGKVMKWLDTIQRQVEAQVDGPWGGSSGLE